MRLGARDLAAEWAAISGYGRCSIRFYRSIKWEQRRLQKRSYNRIPAGQVADPPLIESIQSASKERFNSMHVYVLSMMCLVCCKSQKDHKCKLSGII